MENAIGNAEITVENLLIGFFSLKTISKLIFLLEITENLPKTKKIAEIPDDRSQTRLKTDLELKMCSSDLQNPENLNFWVQKLILDWKYESWSWKSAISHSKKKNGNFARKWPKTVQK